MFCNIFKIKDLLPINKTLLVVSTLFLLNQQLFSQEEKEDDLGTEVVNIVKPYTPTISDAFKIKQLPVLNDSTTVKKKEVKYTIFSVPVASVFTPAKAKAATVEKVKTPQLYDNYATLGLGNFTTIIGELYSNFKISKTDNLGVFFRHNSSQGGIDGVRLDNQFYDTQLDATYTNRQRDFTYNINTAINHQLFNWYGLNGIANQISNQQLSAIDTQQNYLSFYTKGSIFLKESIFKGAQAEARFLTDSFSSSEINFTAQPTFILPLTDFQFRIKGDIDFLSGKFEQDYFNTEQGIDYGNLIAGVTPSLEYVKDDLTLSLGATVAVGLDTEANNTDFFIYPQLNASYRLIEELLIAYGGAKGGLHQNTYYKFKEANPFVSPTLLVAPTNETYTAFAGVKGKLTRQVGYNLRTSFGREENKALFNVNPFQGIAANLEGYAFGNSFGVVYDNINTLHVFGELKVDVSTYFSLGATANFYNYGLDNLEEAYNLPTIAASVFSNFNITKNVYGGVSVFYVGERVELVSSQGLFPDNSLVTLEAYIDANVHLGYRYNNRLSIFAKGSNLIGENYQKWINTPVQGIQALVGATYNFDW